MRLTEELATYHEILREKCGFRLINTDIFGSGRLVKHQVAVHDVGREGMEISKLINRVLSPLAPNGYFCLLHLLEN